MANETDNPWWLDLAIVVVCYAALAMIALAIHGCGGAINIGD